MLDVAEAVRRGDGARVIEVGAIGGPGGAIEDLATDGATLWTSDESSFRFYGDAARRRGTRSEDVTKRWTAGGGAKVGFSADVGQILSDGFTSGIHARRGGGGE